MKLTLCFHVGLYVYNEILNQFGNLFRLYRIPYIEVRLYRSN